MTEPVRREPTADACCAGGVVQLDTDPAAVQGRPRVGPRSTQNSAPGGRDPRISSQAASWSQAERSMPTSRRFPLFRRLTSRLPRVGSRSLSLRASASRIRSAARHSTTMTPRSLMPSALSPAARITAMISATVGGSAG
jgi:hypothetical protein